MAVIALLIKFDLPGPVLFRQQRHWDGRIIQVFKFRHYDLNQFVSRCCPTSGQE
ncbi:MAG: sugar transferase [Haliea sp.]|nr:sugar transferase [Haliea sp.]